MGKIVIVDIPAPEDPARRNARRVFRVMLRGLVIVGLAFLIYQLA
jgi:hypothetical protein